MEAVVLIVVGIIKVEEIMNGTSLEWPIPPMFITIGFSGLMEFGWLFVASIRPEVVHLMPNAHTTGIHDTAISAGPTLYTQF